MTIYTAATLLAAADKPDTDWSLKSAITNGTALLALALGAVLLYIALRAALSNSKDGDVGGTMNTAGVVLICVGIAALGTGGVALLYGQGILNLFGGIWS